MPFAKFSIAEFGRCVRAIFAFGAGYKRGENYALGAAEETRGKRADPEAWQLGYDLATKRNSYREPTV